MPEYTSRNLLKSLASKETEVGPPRRRSYNRAPKHRDNERINIHRRQSCRIHLPQAMCSSFVLIAVTQPPECAGFGQQIDVPVIIEVRCRRGLVVDAEHGRLLTVVTLVSVNNDGTATPVQPGALVAPSFVDSVHPPSTRSLRYSASGSTLLGFSSFSHFAIFSLGSFRLRISLLRLGPSDRDDLSPLQGATTLQIIDSDVITINP